MADTGDFGKEKFDAAVFAQELLCVSLASGAIGGVASALIRSTNLSNITGPALACGTVSALATAVGESIHTLLDRQKLNPLTDSTAVFLGPVLGGGANVLIRRAQIIQAPPENPFLSFALGAGSGIAGRVVAQYVVGTSGKFEQLPNT